MLTSKQYVSFRGERCPVCEKKGAVGWSFSVSNTITDELIRTVSCIFCHTVWDLVYKLVEMRNVTERIHNANSALQKQS